MLALTLWLAAVSAADDGRVLTGLVASAAAEDARADVLTAADLKSALEVESQKQLLACDESTSCLAEIAAALDASIVISGTLGQLDDERVLQLSAFDAKRASSAGRQTARASTMKELATAAEAATRKLVAPVIAAAPPGTRVRILVLDLDTSGAVPSPSPSPPVTESPSSFGILSLIGTGVGILGLTGAAIGFAADQIAGEQHVVASDPTQNVVDARAAREQVGYATATSVIGWSTAVLGVAGGVALIVVDIANGAE